ncbi:MAG TPA: biotin/lipoyl-containing protein [Gemmatimonadaceae bacterium]|nr:biotin/lipoyl-containing protein [Gemmatimonadaceae bacterium]
MRYLVTVNGERVEVLLDGEGVHVEGSTVPAHIDDVDGTPVKMVTVGDEVHRVVVRRGEGRGRYTLWLDGHRYDLEAVDERTHAIRQLSGAGAAATGPAPLKAPMPGLVVRVNVAPGDSVTAGQGLVVIEAMKMENELRASAAGRVRAVHAVVGQAVEKGALLVEME